MNTKSPENIMRKFCKIIDLPDTQVLVVKATETDLEVTAGVGGVLVTNTMEFSTKEQRDKGFDRMSKRFAMQLVIGMVKGVQDA